MARASRVRPAFCFAAALLVATTLPACSPRFDWRELREPALGFTAVLPGKPQRVSRAIELDAGAAAARVEMTMLSSGIGPTLFAVGSGALPQSLVADPAAVQNLVEAVRTGLQRNVQASASQIAAINAPAGLGQRTLRAASGFVATGVAGRRGAPARLVARVYVVDDRLYQLVVIGADGAVPDEARATFFDSFRLLPP